MGYLLLGFILGVAVSWFWQAQFSGVPAFKQLMQKELAVNGQLGSLTLLKKKIEVMEKRLEEINKSEKSVVEEKQAAEEVSGLPAEGLTVISSRDKVINRPGVSDRRMKREEVLVKWNKNQSIEEIAAETNLGKGEIELIIALQKNQANEGRCS